MCGNTANVKENKMKFKDFMDLYDNWNGITKVNDNELKTIIRAKTVYLMDKNDIFAPFPVWSSVRDYEKLFNMEVVSFGFYDGDFCVRVK